MSKYGTTANNRAASERPKVSVKLQRLSASGEQKL